jgi:hypothetical protein
MRPGKVTSLDLRLGLFHETARQRVTRVEHGKLRLKLLKLSGNLGQLLRQLLDRHITLSEDAEHGQNRALGDAKPIAQFDESVRKRTGGSCRSRFG